MDTILRPEWLLAKGALHTGWEVRVEAGRIASVGPAHGPVDLPDRLLMAGFVNAHSHAFQRGIRGLVQWSDGIDDFWSWRERMYGLANVLDPEGVEAVSALAFLEMAQAGVTCVGEFHYLHHQPDGVPYADPDELALRVIAAARRVGIRIALLRVAYARPGFEQEPNPLQRRFYDADPEAVLAAASRLGAHSDPAVTAGIAPHSVRAVPRDWLEALSRWEGPIHAHVDEQPAEVEQCVEEHGLRPLDLLAEAGLVHERFCAVHFTWPTEGEISRLRDAGGRVCACPTTEMDLGDGFLPIEKLEGIEVCVGSDSQVRIDPLAEVRALEWHARARLGRRNVLSPPGERDGLALRLLDAGTRVGADALGVEAGLVTPGQWADLMGVEVSRFAVGEADLLSSLVFSADARCVQDVWVGGRRIVANGHHDDAVTIRANARAVLETLL